MDDQSSSDVTDESSQARRASPGFPGQPTPLLTAEVSGDQETASDLAAWSCDYKIPLEATASLLRILRKVPSLSWLPKDSRTLRSCARSTTVRKVDGGIYVHYGLAEGISRALSMHPLADSLDNVGLLLNIDGVSLSASSKSCLWPIMCSVADISNSAPFIVGCFHAYSKPNSVHEFLAELIPELKELLENGFEMTGRRIRVSVKAFVCDTPARAFLLGIKSHTGYSCCGKCQVR